MLTPHLQSAQARWAAAATDSALKGSPTWEMQHAAEGEALRAQEPPSSDELYDEADK